MTVKNLAIIIQGKYSEIIRAYLRNVFSPKENLILDIASFLYKIEDITSIF